MTSENQPNDQMVSLRLSQQSTEDSPFIGKELVADLRAAVKDIFSDLAGSGRKWVKGKSEQELAKAREILSEAIDRIGRLQLAADRQMHEQKIETDESNAKIEAMKVDTRLQAFERVIKIVKELNELGVEADIQAIMGQVGVSAAGSTPGIEHDE